MSYKRYAVAAAAAAVVFTGVYGAAATLLIDDSAAAQAGSTDLVCDENGVKVEFTGFSGSTGDATFAGAYTFTGALVSGIHKDCVGSTMAVRLKNGATVAVATRTLIVANGTGNNNNTVQFGPGGPFSVADATDLELAIVSATPAP